MPRPRSVAFRCSLVIPAVLLPACHTPSASPPFPTTSPAPRLRAKQDFYSAVAGQRGALRAALAYWQGAHTDVPTDPEPTAYLGASIALSATHSPWPPEMLSRTTRGLALLDAAVASAPQNLEIRFLRAMTNYNLPLIANRRGLARADLDFIAPRAEQAARAGTLAPALAAAALYHHAQVHKDDRATYLASLGAAARIAPTSPAGQSATDALVGCQ